MNESEFKTSDTPLAAYLITEGYTLLDVEKDGRRVFFLFSNHDETIHNAEHNFHAGTTLVEPSVFFFNYRKLVRRIRDGG